MSNGDARWTSVRRPASPSRRRARGQQGGSWRRARDDPRSADRMPVRLQLQPGRNRAGTARARRATPARGPVRRRPRSDLDGHRAARRCRPSGDDVPRASRASPRLRQHAHVRPPAVATPAGESRSNNEVFGELLRRFGLVRPGDAMTDQESSRDVRGGRAGRPLRRQLAEHVAKPAERPIRSCSSTRSPDAGSQDPSRPCGARSRALDGLYRYKPTRQREFPLALISPALATQISSTFGQLRTAPAALEMSPADAAARNITNGASIRVWNALGEVRCIAKVSTDVREGVCVMPKGLWRKHSRNGYTSNALIPASLADLGGQAAFNDARIQVAKRAARSGCRPSRR